MRTESEKKAFVRYKITEVKCSASDIENARLILSDSVRSDVLHLPYVGCNKVHSRYTDHIGVLHSDQLK